MAGQERRCKMTPDEKQSGIHCVLIGTDGNIFNGKFIVMESFFSQ